MSVPRVLLDESVPRDLLLHLVGIEAATVQSLGWAGMKNGVLLRATREAGIQILVTVDRRMEYQQNIPKSGLALLVLEARSTRLPDLLPLVPALLIAIAAARAGEITHVAGSSGQHLQAELLHNGQQLERRAARPLGAGFPFLHGARAGVEVAGENRLTDVVTLPEALDLKRVERCGYGEAGLVEAAHRVLADRPDLSKRGGGGMDGLECRALELLLSCQGESR